MPGPRFIAPFGKPPKREIIFIVSVAGIAILLWPVAGAGAGAVLRCSGGPTLCAAAAAAAAAWDVVITLQLERPTAPPLLDHLLSFIIRLWFIFAIYSVTNGGLRALVVEFIRLLITEM